MNRKGIVDIIYGASAENRRARWTQDSPILLDVWVTYAEHPDQPRQELLLTPHNASSPAELYKYLRDRLEKRPEWQDDWGDFGPGKPFLLFNESVVLANLTLTELVEDVLPLSDWWHTLAAKKGGSLDPDCQSQLQRLRKLLDGMQESESPPAKRDWAVFFGRIERAPELAERRHGLLWTVNVNRRVEVSAWLSRETVKADAARLLFKIDCSTLRWAVVDGGIDATHPAFWRRDGERKPIARDETDPDDQFQTPSRIRRTYDFTRLKELLHRAQRSKQPIPAASYFDKLSPEERKNLTDDLQRALLLGRPLNWALLEPFLRVPHEEGKYEKPESHHGTHVAGILAADWPEAVAAGLDQPFQGVCPDLELYDFRVVGPESGDEFTIMAALQFIRYLNSGKDLMVVHGANLSLSVPHNVASFACGRTPVCEECERLVASGVVVVAAAGNMGYSLQEAGTFAGFESYNATSITDPGNADSVITVGATHGFMPHNYGVSYFSSRGPTGDGRAKPDLVAPGEKIVAPVPGSTYETMDGTSMAAPHVSGAAALLLARHRELVGEPLRVKQILCDTATDLGRERYFQGHGLVDVLRALQSI
jgi:serine protease AprX